MIKTVIRDASGEVINIGPWDDLGGINPLPAGATSAAEDITTLIPTDADVAEREMRASKTLIALARIALGNNTATEDAVVAAIRARV